MLESPEGPAGRCRLSWRLLFRGGSQRPSDSHTVIRRRGGGLATLGPVGRLLRDKAGGLVVIKMANPPIEHEEAQGSYTKSPQIRTSL